LVKQDINRQNADMKSTKSSLTHQLDGQWATVGDWTFVIAGVQLWNSLPPDIVALTHCHGSINFLFSQSFLFRQFSLVVVPTVFLLRPR